jgi:predicted porin
MPWSRLSLQAGLDYVLSETKTPVSDYVPSGFTAAPILASQNNYWTVNFSSDFVVDDKTDLNLAYFYYQADDYQDNSSAGLAVGAGAHEHGVTATLTRRITKNLRASLKYSYYNYEDAASGGFNNFEAHLIFASMQYRF